MVKLDNTEDVEFYLSTKDRKDGYMIYSSDSFKLSEIDLINLIKICLIEARSKIIGRKILSVYQDSTEHRKQVTIERLKLIGVNVEHERPTNSRKAKHK
jgi:hypothetical protein